MSGNIQDTNVDIIRAQIESFIKDLQDGDFCTDYPERYKELHETSLALFNMVDKTVRNQINIGTFNHTQFVHRVNSMLDLIVGIQDGSVSQHKASEMVGTTLAKEYVNACKD